MANGAASDVFLIALATLGLVAERAAEAPLLCVVEDAHWLDRPSAQVLEFVARRVESDPAILLFAVREGLPSSFDEAGLPELRLAGLDEDASSALLDLAPVTLPPDLRRRILDEAAGNPLALIELPAAAAELGTGAPPSGPLPLTARLEQAFTSRLTNLSADVQRLLLLAALDDVDLAALSRAAETSVEPDDLSTAVAAGLGTLESGRFRFRHPLIRSAVEQAATPEELRHAHAALAEALADEPDRAVWHRAAAASGPDEEVALALEAAAERATLRGGGDAAVAAYERSAELTTEPHRRALRLFRAGDLALERGHSRDGVRLLRTAQQTGLPTAEHAIASFYLELAESTWSGSATIRDFARIARELVTGGEGSRAFEALWTVSVRAFWERLDDETRREIAAISDEIQAPADDPVRLSVLGLARPDRQGQAGRRASRARFPPSECRTRSSCSQWAQPHNPFGPTRSLFRFSGLRPRGSRTGTAAAARAHTRVQVVGRASQRSRAQGDHQRSGGCADRRGDPFASVHDGRTARPGDRRCGAGRG